MKKACFSFLTSILIICFAITSFGVEKMGTSNIKVIFDGTELEFDVPPEMVHGKVMAELKTLVEKVDGKVSWEQETKMVTVEDFMGKKLVLQIGSKKAYLNGEEIYLDLAPKIVDNRTFIPLRSFTAFMGGSYSWSTEKQMSTIYFGIG